MPSMRPSASASTKTKANQQELPLEARAIQCITDFKAPKTTQDTVDIYGAELTTASLLRSAAEKRYEAVKRSLFDAHEQVIAKVRNDATEHMTKSTDTLYGEDWQLDFSANKPATRCDVDELRTELVRCGIKVDVIDAAIAKVSKKSTPALIMTAKLKA